MTDNDPMTDKESSTRKRCKSTVKRWNLFAAKEKLTLGEENFPSLVDDEGQPTKESRKLLQRWAQYLDSNSDMTHSIWSTSLNWTQDKIKQQMAAHDLSDPKGHMRGLPTVQKLNKKWCVMKNGIKLIRNNEVKCVDVQAKLEKNMSETQKLQAFEACLNDDIRLKCRPINSLNVLCSFASTHAH